MTCVCPACERTHFRPEGRNDGFMRVAIVHIHCQPRSTELPRRLRTMDSLVPGKMLKCTPPFCYFTKWVPRGLVDRRLEAAQNAINPPRLGRGVIAEDVGSPRVP